MRYEILAEDIKFNSSINQIYTSEDLIFMLNNYSYNDRCNIHSMYYIGSLLKKDSQSFNSDTYNCDIYINYDRIENKLYTVVVWLTDSKIATFVSKDIEISSTDECLETICLKPVEKYTTIKIDYDTHDIVFKYSLDKINQYVKIMEMLR